MSVRCGEGNCTNQVEGGEGITVSGAGYRKRFCCWHHAALWTLAMGARYQDPQVRAQLLRALAEAVGNPRKAV